MAPRRHRLARQGAWCSSRPLSSTCGARHAFGDLLQPHLAYISRPSLLPPPSSRPARSTREVRRLAASLVSARRFRSTQGARRLLLDPRRRFRLPTPQPPPPQASRSRGAGGHPPAPAAPRAARTQSYVRRSPRPIQYMPFYGRSLRRGPHGGGAAMPKAPKAPALFGGLAGAELRAHHLDTVTQ